MNVNGKDDIPYMKWKNKNFPKHQSDIKTTLNRPNTLHDMDLENPKLSKLSIHQDSLAGISRYSTISFLLIRSIYLDLWRKTLSSLKFKPPSISWFIHLLTHCFWSRSHWLPLNPGQDMVSNPSWHLPETRALRLRQWRGWVMDTRGCSCFFWSITWS